MEGFDQFQLALLHSKHLHITFEGIPSFNTKYICFARLFYENLAFFVCPS